MSLMLQMITESTLILFVQLHHANNLPKLTVPLLMSHSYPVHFIIAEKCFTICRSTSGLWFLENPPGRIERFLPSLTPYRVATWSGPCTNKEYVLYSNFIILCNTVNRYGKISIPGTKLKRDAWQPDLIENIKSSLPIKNYF